MVLNVHLYLFYYLYFNSNKVSGIQKKYFMQLKTQKTSWTNRRIDWKTTTPPVASVSWNLCSISLLQKGKVLLVEEILQQYLTNILKFQFRCNVFRNGIYGSCGGCVVFDVLCWVGKAAVFLYFLVPRSIPLFYFPGCGGLFVLGWWYFLQ